MWQVQAQALGLNPGEMELYELMVNFHNFTHQQFVCLRDIGGYSTLEDLVQWRYKSIRKWCETMSSMTVARGGRTFGDLKIKQLQGIAWWATDRSLRNLPIDVNDYKASPDVFKLNAELDHLDSEQDTVSVDKPKKFAYKDWIEWEESVYMYFDSLKNLQGIPYSYVIRKDLAATQTINLNDRKMQMIYTASLNGFLFGKDNTTVGNIIRECCLGTEAESWITNLRGGREAMVALRNHYDGPDEAKKRLSSAKAKLEKLFYRNEATFSFEKYVTALNGIWNIHVRYDEPIYESDKVRYLLDKCQNSHQEFRQTLVLCRSQHDTFAGAVTMLKESVGRLFPNVQRKNKRNIADISSSKGKGKGKGKLKEYNGVDVSDLTRWYEKEELDKLPRWLQKKICTNKDHQNKQKDKISKVKRAKVSSVDSSNTTQVTTSTTSSSGLSTSDERVIAAVINGLHRSSNSTNSRNGSVTFPLNGRNATIASSARNNSRNTSNQPDDASALTFDHNGDVV